jgi:RNA polymerase primary sigma factor
MDQTAREELILANQALVLIIAKKYHIPGLPLKDLVQEGNIGLMKAAESFDPTKGKFGTYAFWLIKAHILKAIEKNWLVHGPSRQQDANRPGEEDPPPCQIVELDESVTVAPGEEDGLFKAATQNETKQVVQGMLKALTERERQIICLRFGIGDGGEDHTIEEIGRSVGLTPERVRQILSKALGKMRKRGIAEIGQETP